MQADETINHLIVSEYQVLNLSKNHSLYPQLSSLTPQKDSISHHQSALSEWFGVRVYPYLFKKTGFKVTVLNAFPDGVGFNPQITFYLCKAHSFVEKYLNLKQYKQAFQLGDVAQRTVITELASALEGYNKKAANNHC